MEKFGLLTFLRQNPLKENVRFVFPSPDDINIDPELFFRAVKWGYNDRNEQTIDFFRRFLSDLHKGEIGEFLCFNSYAKCYYLLVF